jgi:hypothetical protein
MDERWVHPRPEQLADRAWQSFSDRFPLVVEDLTALSFPEGMPILAEGFGLTPELMAPLLTDPAHAVWLIPTDEFKHASMRRRRKGEFGGSVSDPDRALHNLLQRDRLIGEHLTTQARSRGIDVVQVDELHTIDTGCPLQALSSPS